MYAGAKGGLIAFTKSLARETARYQINVNCVCPGPTDTPLMAAVPDKVKDALIKAIPFRRLGKPEEVADAVVFFAGARRRLHHRPGAQRQRRADDGRLSRSQIRADESADAMDYTLPEFLAHAIALEHEAAERYLELADMMEAHRNDEVSALFRDMVRFSRLHHDSIVERAGGVALPTLRSWQYRWTQPPEAGGDEAFDYTLDAYERAALRARERGARDASTTADVGQHSSDPEVKRLAAEFAAEETEHVEALEDWLARTPRPGRRGATDPRAAELALNRDAARAHSHRRRMSSGTGMRVDAPAVLRVAHAEHARLDALADQVVAARDDVLLQEDLVAPLFDVGADQSASRRRWRS